MFSGKSKAEIKRTLNTKEIDRYSKYLGNSLFLDRKVPVAFEKFKKNSGRDVFWVGRQKSIMS